MRIKFNNLFSENHAVYDNVGKRGGAREANIIRLMRFANQVCKATRGHAHAQEYLILIILSPQQCFRERALKLRCKYIACLVVSSI
jgi:hypothetical protein